MDLDYTCRSAICCICCYRHLVKVIAASVMLLIKCSQLTCCWWWLLTILECQLFNFDYPHGNLDKKKVLGTILHCNATTILINGALQTCMYSIDYSSTFCCSRQLNNDITTICWSDKVTIEKWGEILYIDLLCVELVVICEMELAWGRGGRNREQMKVWKESKALANIELIAHILNIIYIYSLKCS